MCFKLFIMHSVYRMIERSHSFLESQQLFHLSALTVDLYFRFNSKRVLLLSFSLNSFAISIHLLFYFLTLLFSPFVMLGTACRHRACPHHCRYPDETAEWSTACSAAVRVRLKLVDGGYPDPARCRLWAVDVSRQTNIIPWSIFSGPTAIVDR